MEDNQIYLIYVGTIIFLFLMGLCTWFFLSKQKHSKSHSFGPVGEVGFVMKAAESIVSPGRVKVFADEFDIVWSDDAKQHLVMNEAVRILSIQGNKVTVEKLTVEKLTVEKI